MSDDASTTAASKRDRTTSALKRSAKWLGAIVVASLVLPALTTQWADRQNELALKEGLVSQLTFSAATAIEEAHALVLDETQSEPPPPKDLRSRYSAFATAWNVAIYTLESKLKAYFPDAELQDEPGMSLQKAVHEYNLRVQDYILLSGEICAGNQLFKDASERLTDYLGTALPNVSRSTVERSGDPYRCWRRSEAFRRAYQDPIGLRLLNKRDRLVETIVDSGAQGYNVGFQDFLRQIVPLA